MKSVLIIGAGLSGLTAATALKKRGYAVTVLETSSAPGGVAKTLLKEGFRCELGPNTFMISQPETITFLKENQLLNEALDAAPLAKNRFVVKKGRLIPLPLNPFSLLSTPLLSFQAKKKIVRGFFSSTPAKPNETVADFFRREFGEEVLNEIVDPFVSGIWAGDPKQLSLRFAFPKLYSLKEEKHSLAKVFLTNKKTGVKRRLISWPEGLGYLSEKLANPLGQAIHFNTNAHAISRQENKFCITTDTKTFTSDFLILATPFSSAVRLLAPWISEANLLSNIPQASLNVVHLGFDRSAIQHPLNGFGVLISRSRGIRTLGALFSSTLFPQRAPKHQALLTAFIGGVQDPNTSQLSEETLSTLVQNDLRPLLKITGTPTFQNVVRWPSAIPQYDLNQSAVLELYKKIENEIQGLYLLGNYRGGISLENVILTALHLANQFKNLNRK